MLGHLERPQTWIFLLSLQAYCFCGLFISMTISPSQAPLYKYGPCPQRACSFGLLALALQAETNQV